jgi:hypothetical protein
MPVDDHLLHAQLQKIEKIIEKKAEDLDKQNYEKYIGVFQTAIRYLRKHPVMLYGGLAIHEAMPKNLKIYGPYNLPDIDVFSYKAGELAKGLKKHMEDHGYPLTTVSEALHEGTLKVYSQGQQIVDLTYIPKNAYRKLSKGALMSSFGLKIVNPQYLRMSLHKMLALPNLDRWEKVLKRIVNFYQAFPPAKCNVKKLGTMPSIPTEVVDAFYNHEAMKDAVYMGVREVALITEKELDQFEHVPPVIAVVSNPHEVANALAKDMNLKVSHTYKTDVQSPLPAHVVVTYKRKKVAVLFDAISCFTYNMYKGVRIASLHSILYIYMSIMFSTYAHFDGMEDAIECVANALSLLQINAFQSKRKVLQQFATECFGEEHGLATLRRARQERRLQK